MVQKLFMNIAQENFELFLQQKTNNKSMYALVRGGESGFSGCSVPVVSPWGSHMYNLWLMVNNGKVHVKYFCHNKS